MGRIRTNAYVTGTLYGHSNGRGQVHS
jgi:hypothetical protein